MSSGKKKTKSPSQSDLDKNMLEKRLADLRRRHQSFLDAGMTETIWGAQIEQLENKLEEINNPEVEDLDNGE